MKSEDARYAVPRPLECGLPSPDTVFSITVPPNMATRMPIASSVERYFFV